MSNGRSQLIIRLDHLDHNLSEVRRLCPCQKIIVMVKGNAYGHGLVGVARHLQFKVDYFGVAFIEEAIKLRRHNIQAPIIVFNPYLKQQVAEYLRWDVDCTVASVLAVEELEHCLAGSRKPMRIHLKIDTGMRRIGIRHSNAHQLFEAAQRAHHCQVASVFSHLATADDADLSYTKLQLERFREALSWFAEHDQEQPPAHLANSAAIMRMPETHLDMVRPGLMVYGYHPSAHSRKLAELRPALIWKSRVTYFKVIEKGNGVGYGLSYVAPEDIRAVTIPIGYADGFRRGLSNKGEVLIRGRRYPVIGRVCMDQTVISVGQGEAYRGDEVVIIGSQGQESIDADEIAAKLDTVSYEILTGIMQRVPRVYTMD